jgi:uncharacterized protein YkwD
MIRRAACIGVLALGACAAPEAGPPAGTHAIYASLGAQGATLDAAALQGLVNTYRQGRGLAPLALDPTLMRLAEERAAAMAARGDVAHGQRGDIAGRLRAAGIAATVARESVSAGYFSAADAFSGWRGAPEQDATLRLPAARRMGVAAVHRPGSRHNVYWAVITSD